jgi:S-adenosylmethionine synthetase
MESDNADGEVFLFTSESVGEGHPGKKDKNIFSKFILN